MRLSITFIRRDSSETDEFLRKWGDIYLDLDTIKSLIEFVLLDLYVFMTKCKWYESTIPCVRVLLLLRCMQDEILKNAMFAEILKNVLTYLGFC